MMRFRKRKLSPFQRQLYDQVIAVLPETIARCETSAQLEQMETHVYRLRSGGLITDREYQEFQRQILNVYLEKNITKITRSDLI